MYNCELNERNADGPGHAGGLVWNKSIGDEISNWSKTMHSIGNRSDQSKNRHDQLISCDWFEARFLHLRPPLPPLGRFRSPSTNLPSRVLRLGSNWPSARFDWSKSLLKTNWQKWTSKKGRCGGEWLNQSHWRFGVCHCCLPCWLPAERTLPWASHLWTKVNHAGLLERHFLKRRHWIRCCQSLPTFGWKARQKVLCPERRWVDS